MKKKLVDEATLWAAGRQTKATRKADARLRKFVQSAEERAYTLQEIATVMGVSRERVRQIEARALKKLYRRLGQILKNEGLTPEDAMQMVGNASTETGVMESDMPSSP